MNNLAEFFSTFRLFILLTGLAVACPGCFSIESGYIASTGDEHVLVSNYGWRLFHFIPLACGNADDDAFLPFVLFRDDVTMDQVQRHFFKYVEGKGNVTVDDLSYQTHESVLFTIPGSDISIPIPYLVSYKEIQLSGILVPKKGGVK